MTMSGFLDNTCPQYIYLPQPMKMHIHLPLSHDQSCSLVLISLRLERVTLNTVMVDACTQLKSTISCHIKCPIIWPSQLFGIMHSKIVQMVRILRWKETPVMYINVFISTETYHISQYLYPIEFSVCSHLCTLQLLVNYSISKLSICA